MELGNGFGVEKRHIITSLILIELTKEFNSINFSSTIVYYDAYSIVNIISKYGIMYTVSHLKSILFKRLHNNDDENYYFYFNETERGDMTYGVFQQSFPS